MRHTLPGILITTAFAVLSPAQKIVGGPFVVNAGTSNATIAWIVQDSQVTLHEPDQTSRTSPTLRVEKTTLTSLKPNTRYEYDARRDPSKLRP